MEKLGYPCTRGAWVTVQDDQIFAKSSKTTFCSTKELQMQNKKSETRVFNIIKLFILNQEIYLHLYRPYMVSKLVAGYFVARKRYNMCLHSNSISVSFMKRILNCKSPYCMFGAAGANY